MKRIFYAIASVALIFFQTEKINAQQALPQNSSVHILSSNVNKIDSLLFIEITLDLSDLDIESDRVMTITPLLESKYKDTLLSKVLVNGREKHIIYQRNAEKGKDATIYAEVLRKNNTPQTINYKTIIPYGNWMNNASLSIEVDLCGCGGKLEENELLVISDDLKIPSDNISLWKPIVAYKSTSVEKNKIRKLEGNAFLDFPVNKTIIIPDYRKNPVELTKILQTIEEVKNDKNTRIDSIYIHGYASPEGSFENNRRLAKGRSEALKQYVKNLYNFDENIFTVDYTPEDWEGLLDTLNKSDLEQKEKIRAIINEKSAPDIKEKKLKEINKGEVYKYMVREWFPSLRHSNYIVYYSIREFNVEESRVIIKDKPQLLSSNEMFKLAQSYEIGSDSFNEVFEIAVRMYPNDPIANLNASSIALEKRDLSSAKKYLEKADKNLPETINNLGVLAGLEGRNEEACTLFQKAADAGFSPAITNFKSLEIK